MDASARINASLHPMVGAAVAAIMLLAVPPVAAQTPAPSASPASVSSSDQEPRIVCPSPGPPGDTGLTNLGPAITGFPVNMAERVGDQLYVFSHRLNPTRIAEYGLLDQRVARTVEVPTDAGIAAPTTWATTAHGPDVYFHQSAPAGQPNLYRYDTVDGELTGVARIPGFLSMAAGADGRIYASANGRVTMYEPATGAVGEIDVVGSDAQVTALATAGDKLYAGTHRDGTSGPGLFEIDVDTGVTTDRTPAELADATRVYQNGVTANERYVAFGTQQEPARFTIVDRQDPTAYHSMAFAGESIIGAITFAGDAVFFSGIVSGNLYRYDLSTRAVERVATPVPNAPTRRSFAAGDSLVGVSAPGVAWEYHLPTGAVTTIDLVGAGADSAPEQPQSLAVTPSRIFVGKNNGVRVAALGGNGPERRFTVPGEAKAMATAGEDVYLALYPNARLWRYDGDTGTMTEVANWRDAQNRPKVAHYHRELDRILVGVQSDHGAGGALVSHDRASGETLLFERPFGIDMRVDAVTGWRDRAVLGGSSVNARLALIDPVSGELGWWTTPVPGGGDIRALVTDRSVIHGLTANGTVFTVDAATGNVLRTVPHAVAGSTPGELLLHDWHLYAVSRQQLVKLPLFGPHAFEPAVVADAIDGGSFNRPALRRGPDCSLYLFTGRDLLRIRDSNRLGAPPPPPPTGTVVLPQADAHVRGGSFAGTNFGSADPLEVKFDTHGSGTYHRRAFLRFDLAGVADPATIETATLRLRVDTIGSGAGWLTVYGGVDDTWTESGLTWDTADHDGDQLVGSVRVTGAAAGDWVEIDVTDHVRGLAAGATFRVESTPNHGQAHVFLASRENGDGSPQLRIS